MRSKLLNADPPVTYAVVLATDEEAMKSLERFVRENGIETASITAIGAFRMAVLGYFDWATKEYKRIVVDEQVEALSLLGDVAVAEGTPTLHIHAVLGKSDGSVVGGHLLEAWVRPTLEVIVTEEPSYLQKKFDPETGLMLIAM